MNDGAYAPIDPARQEAYRKTSWHYLGLFEQRRAVHSSLGHPDGGYLYLRPNSGRSISAAITIKLLPIWLESRARCGGAGRNLRDVYTPMATVMQAAKAKYARLTPCRPDGIHPAPTGFVMPCLLKALDVRRRRHTFLDAKSGSHCHTGHHILSVTNGEIEIESTRYPFCFLWSPTDPTAPRVCSNCAL